MDADVKRLDASFLQTSPKAGPSKKLMHSSNLKRSTVPSGMIFFLQARLQLPVLPLELVTPYTGFCRISDIMKQGLAQSRLPDVSRKKGPISDRFKLLPGRE